MLTTFQARAVDVRALAGAVTLGSVLGLTIGAAYLGGMDARQSMGEEARQAERPAARLSDRPALRTPIFGRPVFAPSAVSSLKAPDRVQPAGLVTALRDRFKMAFAADSSMAPPLHPAAGSDPNGDAHCLAQAVYYEARGETASGQAAVAQVVLNRVRYPSFPKTVCGVVFQRSGAGCQFSFACNGALHGGVEGGAWMHAMQIARRALGGAVMPAVGEATQFHAAGAGESWTGGLLKVAQVGAHVFYRFAGRAGAAAMFHARPEASPPVDHGAALAHVAEPQAGAGVSKAVLALPALPTAASPVHAVMDSAPDKASSGLAATPQTILTAPAASPADTPVQPLSVATIQP